MHKFGVEEDTVGIFPQLSTSSFQTKELSVNNSDLSVSRNLAKREDSYVAPPLVIHGIREGERERRNRIRNSPVKAHDSRQQQGFKGKSIRVKKYRAYS